MIAYFHPHSRSERNETYITQAPILGFRNYMNDSYDYKPLIENQITSITKKGVDQQLLEILHIKNPRRNITGGAFCYGYTKNKNKKGKKKTRKRRIR